MFDSGWEDAKFTEANCMDSVFSLEDQWSQLNFYFSHDPGFGKPRQSPTEASTIDLMTCKDSAGVARTDSSTVS
jgi:hypothetical protein